MITETGKRWLGNYWDFAVECWGLELEDQPHREMAAVLQQIAIDPSTPYGMLDVPRGTYKSSLARAFVVWEQLRQIFLHDNVYHRIAIVSATLALGKEFLRAIEGGLIGKAGKLIDQHLGQVWAFRTKFDPGSHREDGIILAPRICQGEIAAIVEPSIWIGSERRISTGFHADCVVVDDINNKENVMTAERREKIHGYWRRLFAVLGTTDRAGNPTKILVNATPWHDDDVRGAVQRREAEKLAVDPDYESRWVMIHRSAVNPDGTAYFPTKYPLERLEVLRYEMETREFSANYLGDPIAVGGLNVDERSIKWMPRAKFPELRKCRIAIDPNQHSEARTAGCYAAVVMVGFDRWANMYVVDARGSRDWSTKELIDAMFEFDQEYEHWPMYMEEIHMAHFVHALKLEESMRDTKLRVNYVPAPPTLTKYQKWQKFMLRFKTSSVFFAEDIHPALKQEIKEELVRGEVSRFVDFLDALAIADTGVRPRRDKHGKDIDIDAESGKMVPVTPPPRRQLTFNDVLGLDKRFHRGIN